MTIILVIIVQAKILVMDGKHNFVALYVNTMVAGIVKTATRWIYKQDIKGVIKTKIRQKRKIFVAFTFCP